MNQPRQSARGRGEHGSSNPFAAGLDEVPSLVSGGKSLSEAGSDFCEAFDISRRRKQDDPKAKWHTLSGLKAANQHVSPRSHPVALTTEGN